MKKLFLSMALVAAALYANAQEAITTATVYKYVSPITVECMTFDVQALRDSAVNNDLYVASLTALQKQLQAEKEAIDAAVKTLKLEKGVYDGAVSHAKARNKQIATTKKNLESDLKTYEAHLKDIKKQYGLIKKMDDPNCDAVKTHAKRLDDLEKRYEGEKKHIKDLLNDLTKSTADEVSGNTAGLSDFLRELTDKDARLKTLQAQNKTNIDTIKATLKTATSQK